MKKLKDNKIIYIIIILIILSICAIYSKTKKTYTKNAEYDELDTITTVNDGETITFIEDKTNNVQITKGGTYILTGKSENSSVTINTEDEVVLALNNLELTNETGPAILVENAKKVVITLNENTKNYLSNGNNNDYDAVIYSKDDLTINGEGSLEIKANFENGIKCNDDLKIISGNITINSNTYGIIGKDSITIKSGNINITAGKDGIKSNNDEDETLGNIIIEDVNITISSQEDGIQAEQTLMINNGTFNITTSSGASTLSGKTGWENTTQTNDESRKAIKASNITINNGTFEINSKDDGMHSNGNLKIENGTFKIKSSEDGIHADAQVEINDGTFDITASEGLEATYIKINAGNITINGADDGINAGKKTNEYTPTIEINGGYITIKMANGDTDGLDSNGNIYINGGTIDITCNSPFDYDGEAKYKDGKMIINGNETAEITNQMMGGMQGRQNMQGGMGNIEQGEIQPKQGMRR